MKIIKENVIPAMPKDKTYRAKCEFCGSEIEVDSNDKPAYFSTVYWAWMFNCPTEECGGRLRVQAPKCEPVEIATPTKQTLWERLCNIHIPGLSRTK